MPRPKTPYNPNHFICVKTGPWEGPESWLFKVFCAPCGYEELASCRDDAYELRRQHQKTKGTPPKAKNARKAAARQRVLERQKEEEVEWEVFF